MVFSNSEWKDHPVRLRIRFLLIPAAQRIEFPTQHRHPKGKEFAITPRRTSTPPTATNLNPRPQEGSEYPIVVGAAEQVEEWAKRFHALWTVMQSKATASPEVMDQVISTIPRDPAVRTGHSEAGGHLRSQRGSTPQTVSRQTLSLPVWSP